MAHLSFQIPENLLAENGLKNVSLKESQKYLKTLISFLKYNGNREIKSDKLEIIKRNLVENLTAGFHHEGIEIGKLYGELLALSLDATATQDFYRFFAESILTACCNHDLVNETVVKIFSRNISRLISILIEFPHECSDKFECHCFNGKQWESQVESACLKHMPFQIPNVLSNRILDIWNHYENTASQLFLNGLVTWSRRCNVIDNRPKLLMLVCLVEGKIDDVYYQIMKHHKDPEEIPRFSMAHLLIKQFLKPIAIKDTKAFTDDQKFWIYKLTKCPRLDEPALQLVEALIEFSGEQRQSKGKAVTARDRALEAAREQRNLAAGDVLSNYETALEAEEEKKRLENEALIQAVAVAAFEANRKNNEERHARNKKYADIWRQRETTRKQNQFAELTKKAPRAAAEAEALSNADGIPIPSQAPANGQQISEAMNENDAKPLVSDVPSEAQIMKEIAEGHPEDL